MPQRRGGRHLCGIDLIRFAAALLVVVFHLTWQEAATAGVAWYGWIGVQVFFVISGVVIARSAADATPLRFLRSRMLRLYPCALICAAIGVAVLATSHRPQPELAYRFVASVLLLPVGPFLVSAYWTLPVELAFYLLVFVTLWARRPRLETVAVALCGVSAVFNVAYAVQRAGGFAWPDMEFGYDWKNLTLLRHGVYFGLGILISLGAERGLSRVGRVALVVALLGAGLEIGARGAEIAALLPGGPAPRFVVAVPFVLWLALVGAIAASAHLEQAGPVLPPALVATARAAGLTTYPLYLLHEHVGLAVRNVLVRLHMPLLAGVAVAVAVSAALAFAIARFGEPRLRRGLGQVLDRAARVGTVARRWGRSPVG